MAKLTDGERAEVWAEYMSSLSGDREATGTLTKADLRAALDALDTFLFNNESAINQAIPEPARSALAASQKARLLTFVVHRRYITGA